MEFNATDIIPLVKARLGIRVATMDTNLTARINSAYAKMTNQWGIKYDPEKLDHVEVLVDYTCWMYGNRDNSGAMPQWLRLEIRELFLHNHAQEG